MLLKFAFYDAQSELYFSKASHPKTCKYRQMRITEQCYWTGSEKSRKMRFTPVVLINVTDKICMLSHCL